MNVSMLTLFFCILLLAEGHIVMYDREAPFELRIQDPNSGPQEVGTLEAIRVKILNLVSAQLQIYVNWLLLASVLPVELIVVYLEPSEGRPCLLLFFDQHFHSRSFPSIRHLSWLVNFNSANFDLLIII